MVFRAAPGYPKLMIRAQQSGREAILSLFVLCAALSCGALNAQEENFSGFVYFNGYVDYALFLDTDGGADACSSGEHIGYLVVWFNDDTPEPEANQYIELDFPSSWRDFSSSWRIDARPSLWRLAKQEGSTLCADPGRWSEGLTLADFAGLRGSVDIYGVGLRLVFSGPRVTIQWLQACCDRANPKNLNACSVVQWRGDSDLCLTDKIALGKGSYCDECAVSDGVIELADDTLDVRGCYLPLKKCCEDILSVQCDLLGGKPFDNPGALCESENYAACGDDVEQTESPSPKSETEDPPPEKEPNWQPIREFVVGKCSIDCPNSHQALCVNATREECALESGATFMPGSCQIEIRECSLSACDSIKRKWVWNDQVIHLNLDHSVYLPQSADPGLQAGIWSCTDNQGKPNIQIAWLDGELDEVVPDESDGFLTSLNEQSERDDVSVPSDVNVEEENSDATESAENPVPEDSASAGVSVTFGKEDLLDAMTDNEREKFLKMREKLRQLKKAIEDKSLKPVVREASAISFHATKEEFELEFGVYRGIIGKMARFYGQPQLIKRDIMKIVISKRKSEANGTLYPHWTRKKDGAIVGSTTEPVFEAAEESPIPEQLNGT